jgi:hypothetical protein
MTYKRIRQGIKENVDFKQVIWKPSPIAEVTSV